MSSTETGTLLGGWGRTAPTRAWLLRPRSAGEIVAALTRASAASGGLIARGAGRSYGDVAQNAGGAVLDTTAVRGVLALDVAEEAVRVHAGTSFAELLLYLAARGLTLPVVPGTRHLTVGGAIASDVHGKNHPRDGSLGRHLHSMTLCTPARGPIVLSARREPELLHATVGGMGLTGVVSEATLRTVPLRSPTALADIDRTDSLEETVALMASKDRHHYAIAWLDLLAGGAAFGRSVVTRSEEGPAVVMRPARRLRAHGSRRREALRGAAPFDARPRVSVPGGFPGGLLRPAAVRAFNALRWRSSPRRARGRMLTMSAQLFPLDLLGDWNRLYGPRGFLQYQFAVPRGQEEVLTAILRQLRARRLPMYLAVLKRFGPAGSGLLSFPLEGWTVAIDIPADAPGLSRSLDEVDELVAGAGGRVYLAKDARMRPEMLAAMYPGLDRFRELRAQLDPEGVLRSDMARRLGLCE
jgi:decaprenylphospho-beta-D-ribofuranose 2-oxidase